MLVFEPRMRGSSLYYRSTYIPMLDLLGSHLTFSNSSQTEMLMMETKRGCSWPYLYKSIHAPLATLQISFGHPQTCYGVAGIAQADYILVLFSQMVLYAFSNVLISTLQGPSAL